MARHLTITPSLKNSKLHAELLESREVPSSSPITAELPLIQQPGERYAVASTGGSIAQFNVYDAKTNTLLGIVNPVGMKAIPLSVAMGDINGDGIADLIVSGGKGTVPFVKIYDGKTLTEIGSFQPYSKTFFGGVTVAVGDVNGDGRKDIITGAGVGNAAQIKVFSGSALFPTGSKIAAITPNPIRNFFAFDTSYRGSRSDDLHL